MSLYIVAALTGIWGIAIVTFTGTPLVAPSAAELSAGDA